MLALSRLDYARLRPLKNAIYGLLIFSILAVLALGHTARGSQRAINLPFFSFQASELGKVLLIAGARRARRRPRPAPARARHDRAGDARGARAGDVRDRPAGPRLGHGLHGDRADAAVRRGHLVEAPRRRCVALGAVALTFVLVAAPAAGVHVLKPYQVQRLTAFLHPSTNPQKEGYQQEESKIAIGSGQKTGRGPNASQTQTELRAREPHRLRLRRPSASSTASSAPRSCCRSTRC